MAPVQSSFAEVEEPIIDDADLFATDTAMQATQGINCTFFIFCSVAVCIG